nr:MAG: hypothetical protein [Microvirus sp.]
MPYGRSRRTTRRTATRSRRVSGYSGIRSGRSVRPRSRAGGRRAGSGGVRTVKLVIEQASPAVSPVTSQSGALMVPDNTSPKRAKF